MTRSPLAIAEIDVGHLIRRPRAARVAAVAASMREYGQKTPVEVCPSARGRFDLTSGWVRLEAARRLGWTSIDHVVKRATAAERRKREIEDNLLGDGNTVLDRARYLAAGKVVYEDENPSTRHGGMRRGFQVANIGDLKPYAVWAADRYGLALRSVQRACTIGEALDARAAGLLADTAWADHQQGLEALARLGPDQQRAVVALLRREPLPIGSMAEAIELVVGAAPSTPEKKRYSAALSNYAGMAARERKSWLRQVVDDELVPTGVSITFEGEE